MGLQLAVPVGEQTVLLTISPRAHSVRLSLRSSDPPTVKTRTAAVDAYLENVWQALRTDVPLSLTHKQATALAGELYRAWAAGEGRERTIAVEHVRGVGWQRTDDVQVGADEWDAVTQLWRKVGQSNASDALEKALGPIVDRLLLAKGIGRVDAPSRELLLQAFWEALRDAFESRKRNAEGDYAPDTKAERFPEWQSPRQLIEPPPRSTVKVSLMGLVEEWWIEAKAVGRKPSTYESHRSAVAAFVAYLGHDDATRVTREDVVGFKNHRLASINPRNGRPISAKTVKDNDLAGLKTVLGWAVMNGKLSLNAAEGVTIKLGRQLRLRSKGFTETEAGTILAAALNLKRGSEKPWTFAAKKWVPWLCAYTGARVGELAQLRKEDVRREGKHWTITITPAAGTVKTNEARDVVLHSHVVELGFVEFVQKAPSGHLFLKPSASGDVLGPLQAIKNRLAEFVRSVLDDPNVAPNHGWRHTFKTRGLEVGIDHRVLDAIQGQRPRTVAESYGDVTIKTMARAMAKFPRYRLPPRSAPRRN